MAKRKAAQKPPSPESKASLVDISEEDQWKIINDSGILHKTQDGPGVQAQSAAETTDKEEPLLSPLTEEIFRALSLIIPHASLLILFEILVHYQYGRKPSYEALINRAISGVPILAIFIFYSNRYKEARRMQAFLFLLALACGGRLLWLINYANWLDNMKMCPPLATAWIYAIVQLDLGPAVLSLVTLGIWVRVKKLKLTF